MPHGCMLVCIAVTMQPCVDTTVWTQQPSDRYAEDLVGTRGRSSSCCSCPPMFSPVRSESSADVCQQDVRSEPAHPALRLRALVLPSCYEYCRNNSGRDINEIFTITQIRYRSRAAFPAFRRISLRVVKCCRSILRTSFRASCSHLLANVRAEEKRTGSDTIISYA